MKDDKNNNIGRMMTEHSDTVQLTVSIHNECERLLLPKTSGVLVNSARNGKSLTVRGLDV